MDIGAKEIVLVLLGFILAWAPQWFDRRRRIVAHWAALRAEALLCAEAARNFLADGVLAPLYRLPTIAFEKSFPLLLVEGELSEPDILSVTRFFALAQDINRGLDNATKLAQAGETEKLQAEYQRLVLKATTLVEGSDGKGGLSLGAFALINGKLKYSRLLR
jgi:hypothetical protein